MVNGKAERDVALTESTGPKIRNEIFTNYLGSNLLLGSLALSCVMQLVSALTEYKPCPANQHSRLTAVPKFRASPGNINGNMN
jgi:hypothetical protein